MSQENSAAAEPTGLKRSSSPPPNRRDNPRMLSAPTIQDFKMGPANRDLGILNMQGVPEHIRNFLQEATFFVREFTMDNKKLATCFVSIKLRLNGYEHGGEVDNVLGRAVAVPVPNRMITMPNGEVYRLACMVQAGLKTTPYFLLGNDTELVKREDGEIVEDFMDTLFEDTGYEWEETVRVCVGCVYRERMKRRGKADEESEDVEESDDEAEEEEQDEEEKLRVEKIEARKALVNEFKAMTYGEFVEFAKGFKLMIGGNIDLSNSDKVIEFSARPEGGSRKFRMDWQSESTFYLGNMIFHCAVLDEIGASFQHPITTIFDVWDPRNPNRKNIEEKARNGAE
jgi:hypothetical protein